MKRQPAAHWIYRLLLLAYPGDFRRDCGREMLETLKERETAVRGEAGRFRMPRFWARELMAVVRGGLGLRWRAHRRSQERPSDPVILRQRAASLDSLLQDIRFGLRTYSRRPLFTAVAVGTLGLGIGATTAMFSVAEGVLLRPLPYHRPGELVHVWQTFPEWRSVDGLADTWDRVIVSWPGYLRWREGQTLFQEVAVYYQQPGNLTAFGEPEQVPMGFASSSLLPLLGVRPILGRGFLQGEDGPGASHVAILSHPFWQERFGGDRNVLGTVIALEGQPVEVVGVLPAEFRLRTVGQDASPGHQITLWLPAGALGASMDSGDFNFQALGRLHPGITLERAQSETGILFHGDGTRGERGARLVPRDEAERGPYRTPIVLLLGASLVLLIIACGNVASLLSGEMAGRRHEIAARTALGAPRRRILRQLLTESMLLGLAGSAVGILLGHAGTRLLMRLAPPLPGAEVVGVNGTVLAFCVVAGLLSGILFGMAPVLHVRGGRAAEVLRSIRSGEGKRESAFQASVLAAQTALTLVLVVSGLLLTRSLGKLLDVDPGFRTEGITNVQVLVPFYRSESRDERFHLVRDIGAALTAIPGVEEVSGTSSLPFSGPTQNTFPEVPGRVVTPGERRPSAQRRQVLPMYFETLGMPLLAGRTFSTADEYGAPGAVIVSESMAHRFWPDRSPIGEQVIHGDTFTVVGVVGDMVQASLKDEPYPTFYLPLAQTYRLRPPFNVSFVVRTRVSPRPLFRQFRQAVWSVDADLPVTSVAELETLMTGSARSEGFRTMLLAAFGLCALLLAGAGVFGVTARRVAHRTREMGIRMALGAKGRGLIRTAALGTVRATVLGIAVGVLGSLVVTRLLSRYLFGIDAWDPTTYAGAALLLGCLSAAAAVIPARRVTRIAPMEVLREE